RLPWPSIRSSAPIKNPYSGRNPSRGHQPETGGFCGEPHRLVVAHYGTLSLPREGEVPLWVHNKILALRDKPPHGRDTASAWLVPLAMCPYNLSCTCECGEQTA